MRFIGRDIAVAVAVFSVTLMAGFGPLPAQAQTPEWFTCPERSEFKLLRDVKVDALNARVHQPSAGAATSADLAAHARLSAMSYDMYDAYSAGKDPLDGLPSTLKP